MIVWTGWGILSILIFAISIVVGMGDSEIMDPTRFLMAVIIGAGINWFLGKKFNNDENVRIVRDEKTGERLKLENKHTIFFMNMETFSFAMIAIGILIIVANQN